MFTSEMCESEVVKAVRDLVSAQVPELNVWAEPNLPSVFTDVFGALAFSALSEARNGIDKRVLPDTASGEYLDALAARPPYNTVRRGATKAYGCVDVCFEGETMVSLGDVFVGPSNVNYVVCCDTQLDADGKATVEVEAETAGAAGNAVFGQPVTDGRGEAFVSKKGIGQGFDVECDEDLRRRLFAYQPGCDFGSYESLERCALGVTGVAYAKVCEGFGGIQIFIGMKDRPVPTQVDIDAVQAIFDDPCKKLLGICVTVRGLVGVSFDVVIPDECNKVALSDVQAFLDAWIVSVAQPCQLITTGQVETALSTNWPNVEWQVLNGPFQTFNNSIFVPGTVTQ